MGKYTKKIDVDPNNVEKLRAAYCARKIFLQKYCSDHIKLSFIIYRSYEENKPAEFLSKKQHFCVFFGKFPSFFEFFF